MPAIPLLEAFLPSENERCLQTELLGSSEPDGCCHVVQQLHPEACLGSLDAVQRQNVACSTIPMALGVRAHQQLLDQ